MNIYQIKKPFKVSQTSKGSKIQYSMATKSKKKKK